MSVLDLCTQKFQAVEFTGGGEIHASWYRGLGIPLTDPQMVMAVLKKANMGNKIWGMLDSTFPGFEWLISEQQFAQLLMVDCWRRLQGQQTSETSDRLQNPSTGNLFHRIALTEDLVAGIRFWCEEQYGTTYFGFRFRIEALKDKEEDTRQRARRLSVEVAEQYEVLEETLEIKEPSKEAVAQVEQLLENL